MELTTEITATCAKDENIRFIVTAHTEIDNSISIHSSGIPVTLNINSDQAIDLIAKLNKAVKVATKGE